MPPSSALVAVSLMAALTLGGCLGGSDGGPAPSSTSTTTGPASFNGTANGTAGNASVNGTSSMNGTSTGNGTPLQQWMYDNRSGDVSGVGLFVQQPSSDESFTVGNASRLVLNLSVEGNDLTLTLRPPGCNDESCEETTTSSGGTASLLVSSPEPGDWMGTLSAEGVGPQSASYDLSIGQLLPVAGNGTA